MRKVIVFNSVSLDGYFADAKGDMSWARRPGADPEWDTFVSDNARGEAVLVFGRVTYELMAGFWPTPAAAQTMPDVADRMNRLSKIVFSNTLERATWSNTTLVRGDAVAQMRRLKQEAGDDLVVFGSGRLVSGLAADGLVDEFQIVVIPVALGRGRTMFEDLAEPRWYQPRSTRLFRNGNVLLCYEPAR